ncbi:MAG: hypothetical protein HXX15_14325 [Rhodopseudomonas sp.]|uniref:hypothetical protein n=1 Tax=Rhodopseudomonas sp. TaxID=1078 RepID=UPI0017E55AE3|nr:hypothetical protein [Rhodopseudomonas sp.]NVN87252.1 hypothetical protein [Rhodopseudomonas sp.]
MSQPRDDHQDEPLQIIAHAVVQDVRRVGRALDQLIGRLSAGSERSEQGNASGKHDAAFHAFLPMISNGSAAMQPEMAAASIEGRRDLKRENSYRHYFAKRNAGAVRMR